MMSDAPPAPSTYLRRELGLGGAVGIGLGAIIGAGLFVVTGVAAGVAGPAFLLGLLLAGLAAMCNALSSAQLAAVYPVTGGTYEYGYRVLHPWLGFAAGWTFLVSKLAAGGTVALGFARYLAALMPELPERPVALAAVAVLTFVNYRGIKRSAQVNTAIVAITVLVLVAFVLAGLSSINRERFEPFAPAGGLAVCQSAALLFFAFTGYARVATLGEEVHDPHRTIPRAIVLALALASVLYVAVSAVAVGLVGTEVLAASHSPLAAAAQATTVPGLAGLVSVGAVTAMLGVLLSQLLGISRMMLAMARRHDLPAWFDHVHATHAVPDRAVLAAGLVIATLVVVGTLEAVVRTASFSILLYYSVTNLAALRQQRADKLVPDVVPALGLVGCLALAAALPAETWLTGGVLLVLGAGFRVVMQTSSRPAVE